MIECERPHISRTLDANTEPADAGSRPAGRFRQFRSRPRPSLLLAGSGDGDLIGVCGSASLDYALAASPLTFSATGPVPSIEAPVSKWCLSSVSAVSTTTVY